MKCRTILCGILLAGSAVGAAEDRLTLEQALSRVQTHSPALRAAALSTRAAEKAVDAAGRFNNPELFLEAEGIGGQLDLYQDAEYTFGIQQTILRGGKRSAERKAVLQAVTISSLSAEEQERFIAAAVRRAFAHLQAQQEIRKVHAEQVELSQHFLEIARQRLVAGAGSKLEVAQAELALEETRLEQRVGVENWATAKAELAALIDLSVEELPELVGSYYQMEPMESIRIDGTHPTLKRMEAEANLIQTEAQQAQAQDTADITLGAGIKYEVADDLNSFVFSLSMPLSLNKRGRAEHAAGLLRAEAARAAREETQRQLNQALIQTLERHKGAVSRATMLQEQLLPKAEKTYALSQEGYEMGRYSWLELIEAQQHWAELRIRYIEALLDVHLFETELLQLRGTQK